MAKPPAFSIVIPVYNEEASLPLLQERLHKAMSLASAEYEAIYVDDGSSDTSCWVLKDLKKEFPQIRIISFSENKGQSAALYAGFRAAIGQRIITLDADGQNPPEEIARLLPYIGEYDFITGVRKKRSDSFARKIDSHVARFFRWLILRDTTRDTGCSLRVFKRDIAGAVPFFVNFHRFFPFLVRQLGFSVMEVEVSHDQRIAGRSKYGTLKRLRQGIADLLGLLWLARRLIKYEVKYED